MRSTSKKAEISIHKVGEENGAEDEATDTEKYETKKKSKRKKADDDEDEEGGDIEEEDESEEKEEDDTEQENNTYDDTTNTNEEDEDSDDNNEEEEGTNEDNTTSEDGTNNNNTTDDESTENNEKDNKKKNKKKDTQKEFLNSTSFIYNDITIENMEYIPKIDMTDGQDEYSQFKFELIIPFMQKNILLKNILDVVLKKLNFKSVKNIKRCHILNKNNKKNEQEYYLQLEGFNFEAVKKYADEIDINRIGTNDIGGILSIYGIEACRSAIVKEIVNVFDAYSINVDKRHLGLIADYITYQGKYRSFSRKGISYSSSPLLKMTYETTMEFLIDACRNKTYDKCINPSARIVLGKPPLCGTGAFEVLHRE